MSDPARTPLLVEDEQRITRRDPVVKELHTVDEDGLTAVIERLAANPQVDVVKLEKIIELQERILRVQAETAFNDALSEMQPEIPTIIEKASTDKGTYAPEDIVEVVRPIISRHGFSLGFKTEWPDKGTVKVIGILTKGTHSRYSEFQAGADQSGSKNAIQALASSVSYGKRYATKDLLCIVTRGEDDDGRTGAPPDPADDPAGFAKWVLDMEASVPNGTSALMAVFNGADESLRKYLVTRRKTSWESLKVRAAQAAKDRKGK